MRKTLLTKTCMFFLFFTLLVFLLFFAGNFQDFTTASLVLLLDILRLSAFLCSAAAVARTLRLVFAVARKESRQPRPGEFVFAAFCLIFAVCVLFLSQFILGLTLPKL
ncbi:MAG: hypothetical protein LBK13_12455 [Spirochaetales bacterium]|nr:hypothetical protein [Spirochaetales bacterium]